MNQVEQFRVIAQSGNQEVINEILENLKCDRDKYGINAVREACIKELENASDN